MASLQPCTVGESLFWCYANLAMAHAAVARGALARGRTDHLKLVIAWCEREGVIDVRLDAVDGDALPFRLDRIPHRFPPPGELRLWAVALGRADPARESS